MKESVLLEQNFVFDVKSLSMTVDRVASFTTCAPSQHSSKGVGGVSKKLVHREVLPQTVQSIRGRRASKQCIPLPEGEHEDGCYGRIESYRPALYETGQ